MVDNVWYNRIVGVATHVLADRDNQRPTFVGVAPYTQGAFACPISLSAEGATSTRAGLLF